VKKVLIILFICGFHSCSKYQKLLKSDNFDIKYETAVEYYNDSKYTRALNLFEDILSEFKGSSKSEDIYYYYTYSLYHLGDYTNAAFHFRNFSNTFFSSNKAEEMAFMSAKCYYLDASPAYYDQSNTFSAITQLELFVSNYPNSPNVLEAQDLINKLNLILEEKAFNIAESYYKTGKYTAAIYAFNYFIENYPNSNFLEDVFYYQTKSYFELAKNSVEEKKDLRTKEFIFAYQDFSLTYPNSKYLGELKILRDEL